MAADRQAAVRISADGQQVITTYDRVGDAATQAGARIKAATDAANSSTGRFATGLANVFGEARKNIGNLSFQLQDVAVQLQSGSNPLTVLIQQGTQIASVFGPGGAIVGAVGAGLGLIAGYFLSAGDDAETATEDTYAFRDALSFLGDTASATSEQIAKLAGEYRKASAASQELTRLNLERQQRELEAQLAGARGQAGELLGQLPSQRFETVTGGFLVEGRPQAYEDTIQANIDAVRRFAESGSLVGAAKDLDQLAKRAEQAGNTELRDLANRLLDVASAGAETEAQLQTVSDQITALQAASGESSQGFPVSVPRQFGSTPTAAPARPGARVPASRSGPSPETVARQAAADSARAARIEADAERRRYELVVQQINDGADAKYAADLAAADRRRDFTLQTLAEEEARLKQDPAAYYKLTGDKELAPLYDPMTGLADSFRKLSDESQQYGRILGESVQAGAQVASQAFSAFILEGKSGIKDLAKTVADQLLTGTISVFINALVGGAGNALLAGFGGGAAPGATGASPLTYGGPRAGGGRVGSDRWYWVGENGPERFVPDRAGRIEPMSGGGGGGGTVVQVIDQRGQGAPPVETERSNGPDGREQIRMIVRAEVNQAIASGAHDRALRGRFGMKPRPQR